MMTQYPLMWSRSRHSAIFLLVILTDMVSDDVGFPGPGLYG
jgi:hypothetical protein